VPTSTEPRPRRVPPEQATPEPTVGASQVVAAGGLGAAVAGPVTTVAGTAAGLAPLAPLVPLLQLHDEGLEAILEGLRRFFVLSRAREDAWLVRTLEQVQMPTADVLDIVADETDRAAAFRARVEERVRRDVGKALNLPEGKRRDALRAVLAREKTYAEQRSRALADRALASADRFVLRQTSPFGAGWVLDPNVREHTLDCLAMGGRIWPWEALDVLRPPTHPGCRCKLIAAPAAWRSSDVARAVRRAQAAKGLLHEEMVGALIAHGVASAGEVVQAYVGRIQ